MRKIPAALLALTLTASLTAPKAAAASSSTLPELDGHWSQAAFQRWHGYGIVEGDARGMRPDDAMMVSEFAALLSRTMGYTETVENPYADLKGDEWYAPYILQLTAAGILEGDGTNCNADERMTRERASVLFARALGIRPTEDPDLSAFVDGDTAAAWSAGYLDALAKAGIIQGVGNDTLALGQDITRASVVTILDNAVAEYIQKEGAQVTGEVEGILLVAAGDVTVTDAQVSGAVLVAPKAGEAPLALEGSQLKGDLLVEASGADLSLTDTTVAGEVLLSGEENALTLAGTSQAARVAVDGGDNTVALEASASVEVLTARAAVEVDNQGTIAKAEIQASGVVLDGNAPGTVQVSEGVDAPTDSQGKPVTGGEDEDAGEDEGPGGDQDGEDGDQDPAPEAVSGVVGVRPVDQDSPETLLPEVTAQATKTDGEDFVRVALSTQDIVPIHQSEGAGKGAWVGVAFQAPQGYEEETFRYSFGTQESETAEHTADLTENADIGEGKYAVFFVNASALEPKTHITLQWGEAQAVRYVLDLSGVKAPAAALEGVTVSTHALPNGVEPTVEGLTFDESTALVQNGGTGELTQEQISGMGGGGEYTVYYAVPQAMGEEGTLQFAKIARSINGGAWSTWSLSSQTGAQEGSGWWTKDEDHYFFKWGAVFAQRQEETWQLVDGGVYDYVLSFLDEADNVVATCTFSIDLSGYTIAADSSEG